MTHGTAASRMSDLCAAIEIIFQSKTPHPMRKSAWEGEGEGVMGFEEEDEEEVEEEVLEMREQILEYVKLDLLFLLRVRAFKAVLGRCPEFAFELLVREVEDREGG